MADTQEFAELAVDELKEFIDNEVQFVHYEHELYSKLLSWDYIIAHLDERIPHSEKKLHKLTKIISHKLIKIRDLLESGEFHDLRIVKEEEHLLEHLEEDVEHREWQAVKKDIKLEGKEEDKVLRLEKHELRRLYKKFQNLMKIMQDNKFISAIKEDLKFAKGKEDFEQEQEFYFLEIYKFVSTYEKIFKDLFEKEKMLEQKIKITKPKSKLNIFINKIYKGLKAKFK